jgi:hypothetical protein
MEALYQTRHQLSGKAPWEISSEILVVPQEEYPMFQRYHMTQEEQALRLYRLYLVRAMMHHPSRDWAPGEDIAGSVNFWIMYHLLCLLPTTPTGTLRNVWVFVMVRVVLTRHAYYFVSNEELTVRWLSRRLYSSLAGGITESEALIYAETLMERPHMLDPTMSDRALWDSVEVLPLGIVKEFSASLYLGKRAMRMKTIHIPRSSTELANTASLPRSGDDVLLRAVTSHALTEEHYEGLELGQHMNLITGPTSMCL